VARLKDKVALVIGAGSSGPGWGNGKATATLFAREEARIIAVDVNRDAVEETRAIILSEGGRCEALVADATSPCDVERVVGATLKQFGRIDVLHNNVGGPVMGDPIGASVEDWQRALDLNLTSAFLVCKHALPAMQRQGAGAIVTCPPSPRSRSTPIRISAI
jgi:NAD(P)-dependent dehydrogenase (short-subunit alcohol dehydrogenase family)